MASLALLVVVLIVLATVSSLRKLDLERADLWRFDGTLGRGPYLGWGALLFALKHNLDRAVAGFVFHRPWSVLDYIGTEAARHRSASPGLHATLLVLALPFIWSGVALTVRRLRSLGWPEYLAALFFLPYVNAGFFLALCVLPDRPAAEAPGLPGFLDRLIPSDPFGSAAAAVALTLPFVFGFTLVSANVLKLYGWGLFVGVPFCMGLGSALLHGYHEPRSLKSCLAAATSAVVIAGLALLAAAVEGVVCLIMAFPIAIALAWMGAALGYVIQRRAPPASGAVLAFLLAALPGALGAEYAEDAEHPLFSARTAVEIDAPPAVVWRNVVSFSELPPPEHWLFKFGFAYPLRAVIDGRGPGAIRRCEFSTGAFVEPIEIWDEPRLLKFSVASQPPPMRESSPWGAIRPPHLDHFFVSEGGQFLLTPLRGGGTRLEGTTWYRHRIAPAVYWRPWSDFIVHRIHARVLAHIKRLSEKRA